MTNSAPLMALARSETRKATSSAASAGWAGRPIGMPPRESMPRCSRAGVKACAPGDAVDQSVGAFGLNEPGGHGVDPHALGPGLVGQPLAVGGEGGLRRGVAQRCLMP